MSDLIDLTQEDAPKSAVLCAVQLPDVSDLLLRESLDELGRLAKTLGLKVRGEVTQRRGHFDAGSYLGEGRLQDLKALVNADPQATVVLVDHEISPSQARNIETATEAAAVLDRTALILEIFNRHAKSREARMQVEIARLSYMAPRIRESRKGAGDRQRGGIGGKGAGESQMELDRRKLRDRIAELQRNLDTLDEERKTRRARRKRLRCVALCGYTNAGKSTLFHALTKTDAYVADKLFATLDTTVRVLVPETRPRVLVSDTVGFIRNLPTRLVASFKSTLEEALEASLILHVVDAADPAAQRHMETTNAVLAEIGAAGIPQLVCFNKADKLPPAASGDETPPAFTALRAAHPGSLLLSAHKAEDVAALRQALIDYFDKDLVSGELHVPYARQSLRGDIYNLCQVLEEEFTEDGVRYRLRCEPGTLESLQKLLPPEG